MSDPDRARFLAAMYDDTQAPPAEPAAKSESDLLAARKSRRIVMGAVGFDVPTVEYVALLEARVAQQERLLIDQGRQLKRLEMLLSALRHTVRRNVSAVGEVSRDLDRKLDRRDLP